MQDDLTPKTERERMLVMALLRKCRDQPVESRIGSEPFSTSTDTDRLYLHRDYRKPVKKLNVPWEHIKPEYKWAAMDENGEVYVYVGKPEIQTENYTSNRDYENIGAINVGTDGVDWRESLTERPDHK